jgi:dTDP-4-dehydrorhamnose 3,5-epimerase
MNIIHTELPEVLIFEPKVFEDPRGYFFETFQSTRYAEAGIPGSFVQDNFSHSSRSVLRGLHYQLERPQGKMVWVTRGAVFDVAVDVRKGSPRFGHWVGIILNDQNHWQLYIPPGFAHGFCVLSDAADFVYKVTDYYDPESERGIYWEDSRLGIEWPVDAPLVSEKDASYPSLVDIDVGCLPVYEA